MKIKGIRALWGPNLWSVSNFKLIVIQVVKEETEQNLASENAGFYDALKKLFLPFTDRQAEKVIVDDFFTHVKEGAALKLVIEQLAMEMQRLAGMQCGFGPLRKVVKHDHVVFPYEVKEAGLYAGEAAVKIVDCLLKGEAFDFEQDIREMKKIAELKKISPSIASLVNEAKRRGIPAILLDDNVSVQLGYGSRQKRIEAAAVSTTGTIATELTEGVVTAINGLPGLRMNLQPTVGKPIDVAAPVIDILFPGNSNGRIPIVAITGTNGKTTTTRLLAQMAQQGGYTTGYTTTDGIYLNKELIYKGDCSGPASAQIVLRNSAVDFAVLESARGGIIRSGLGFDACDCAVVTNIAEDHLGIDGIDTIEGIAAVKSVVPETVRPEGFAVLNADDDLAYAMKENVLCNVALFTLFADNVRVQQHCNAGGITAALEEGSIIIHRGGNIIKIEEVDNIPITYNGKAKFNIANALAATLAAYVTGISLPAIRCSLRSFNNSTELTPGRMNTFDFGSFTVMVDYAHNPHGLKALGEYIKSVSASVKTGVIAGVGDRRAEDIVALGEEAAKIFDEIIIRMDANLRGRTQSEISSLLINGIQNIEPGKEVPCFSNELDAVEHALNTAKPDSFTVVLVENITSVSTYLQERVNQQNTLKATGMVERKRTF